MTIKKFPSTHIKKILEALGIVFLFMIAGALFWGYQAGFMRGKTEDKGNSAVETEYKTTKSFSDDFSGNAVLEETGSIDEASTNDTWWLNSGGLAYYKNGVLSTIQGELTASSKWFGAYLSTNPTDTDGGTHPQNIFRLVLRTKWKNLEEQAYFKVNKFNLSASENRNQSNGLLLFNRYLDGNNLYYVGLRVDGYAVIKKKMHGAYYTIATQKIIAGENYDRENNPAILPKDKWIGIKSRVIDRPDGSVKIEMYTDLESTGKWEKVLEGVDTSQAFGGAVISNEGYGGIRTDFMDIEFKEYSVSELAISK